MSAKVEPPARRREPQPPVSLRKQLEGSVKFSPQDADGECATCKGIDEPNAKVDVSTGLGIRCWRAWRWGFNREYGVAGHP